MHRDLEAELLRHSKSLRTLARALVGEQHADDLLQDVALQALQRPPARPGPMRAWLAAIARHFAGKQRRAAHNRARFEPHAPQPQPCWPPDRLCEQHESIDRLHAAFRTLPESCRGALQLRFFEGLLPSEIATATGVPLATVKSRLQRGLALLRERLDADGDARDWRAGLAMAFGLHTASAGTAMAITAGGLLIGSGIKVAIGVAAAMLLALGIGILAAPAPQPSRPQTTAAAVEPSRANDRDAASTQTTVAADRTEIATPSRPDAAAATIRGRCVDALQTPIAGIRATLRSGEHRTLVHTEADGRFEFHFASQSQSWCLSLGGDVVAPALTAAWRTIQADQSIDLGDVEIPDVASVRGRVVDAAGSAVLSPELSVSLAANADESVLHPCCGMPHVLADGTFTVRLPPGDYLLHVLERNIVRGERLRVPARAQQVRAEIVVDELEPARRITGIVVGEQGEPLADVRISSHVADMQQTRDVLTTQTGRFELVCGSGDPQHPPTMLLFRDGYAPLAVREPTPWGSRDVRLQMLPVSRFELHVTDAAHVPIENYGVRLWPAPSAAQMFTSADARRRATAPHRTGIAIVAGMGRGEHYLIVAPDSDELCPSQLRLLLPTGTTTRVDVQLLPIAMRTVHVERADGTAAVGVEVLLLDAPARPITLQTKVCSIEELCDLQPDSVLQLQKLTTDAHGDATLRGPPDRRCALKLPDPGHPPLLVPDVDLTVPTPLLVRLTVGARLEGRLVPAARVAAARAMCITYVRERGSITTGLRLVRSAANNGEQVPDQDYSGVPIAADGSFTFAGVAGGSWQLILDTVREGPMRLAEVSLTEGQTTTTTVTMPDMTPAQLDGLVLRNGVPMADADLQILIGRDLMGTGKTDYRGEGVHTDAQGRFHFAWGAGSFRITQLQYTATTTMTLRANEEVTLAAGASAMQTFHLDVGSLRLRLLDARGAPVAGVPLTLLGSDGSCRHQTEPTDADGRVRCDVEVSCFTVSVLPRRLADQQVQQQIRATRPGIDDPMADLRLRLGDVAVRAGSSEDFDLRLPTDWERESRR